MPAVRDVRKLTQLPPPTEKDGARAYCRGLMQSPDMSPPYVEQPAAELCRLVHADTQFAFPWRPWDKIRF